MTSTRIGPTDGSIRSAPMVLEDRTTRWSSPHLTETKASATLRFGYCPTPMTAKSSSSVPCTSSGAVDVEVVAVVEVAVGGPHEPHGLGDLMDRVVVQGGEHGRSSMALAAGTDRCPVGAKMAMGA